MPQLLKPPSNGNTEHEEQIYNQYMKNKKDYQTPPLSNQYNKNPNILQTQISKKNSHTTIVMGPQTLSLIKKGLSQRIYSFKIALK